jgi:hypothetical protein
MANGALMLNVISVKNQTYLSQRHQAGLNTLLRERKAGVNHDLCREAPLDEHRFTDRRAYCAKCNRVKGSTKTNRYFPGRACLSCGSTKTILRDFNGNEIGWEKWVALQNEAALKEMAEYGMDHEYPDYEYK